MSKAPIEMLIGTDERNPSMYMFACGLCAKKTFSLLKRDVVSDREEHELRTGHNVSYLRYPMKRRRASDGPAK